MSEKILSRTSGREAEAGDIVDARVDIAMSHDNAVLVSKVFKEIGVEKVWDKEKIVILFDHRVPANTVETAKGHKKVREFVKAQGIKNFYNIRVGVCHQVLSELGHVRPGELIVGTDSHTTTHGAFGTFSTGIGVSDMAAVWATGNLWLRVPETIKMTVEGGFPEKVMSKDLILHIIGEVKSDGANYKAVEFSGPTIDEMSIASRMTITNMSMEMGAKAALIAPDEKTLEYIKKRSKREFHPVSSDTDAEYECEYVFDVIDLEPQVACPHSVDNVKVIDEVEGITIDQAVLGSCTNGRLEDLEVAAKILDGKRISIDVRMIVIPSSWEVYLEAMNLGILKTFIEAGAIIVNAGCGPCLGAHEGILAAGERCIASTNRNFQGRMGDTKSEVYLASPATVASSALMGEITDPRG